MEYVAVEVETQHRRSLKSSTRSKTTASWIIISMCRSIFRPLYSSLQRIVSTQSPPLLDRMEVIELTGYTVLEKVKIAARFLVPRQLAAHGMRDEHLFIPDDTIGDLVQVALTNFRMCPWSALSACISDMLPSCSPPSVALLANPRVTHVKLVCANSNSVSPGFAVLSLCAWWSTRSE